MVEPLLLLVVLHSLYLYDEYVPVAGADDGDLVFLLACHVVVYSFLVYSIRLNIGCIWIFKSCIDDIIRCWRMSCLWQTNPVKMMQLLQHH